MNNKESLILSLKPWIMEESVVYSKEGPIFKGAEEVASYVSQCCNAYVKGFLESPYLKSLLKKQLHKGILIGICGGVLIGAVIVKNYKKNSHKKQSL